MVRRGNPLSLVGRGGLVAGPRRGSRLVVRPEAPEGETPRGERRDSLANASRPSWRRPWNHSFHESTVVASRDGFESIPVPVCSKIIAGFAQGEKSHDPAHPGFHA